MFRKIQKLSSGQILFFFVLIAIIIRFPFFFRDYIDHDESTFILMGQALVDGHLPYTHYWDLKPPLVFYFFAGVIAVFGKSFVALRLIGSIIVGITAWYTYRLSALHFDKNGSFFAGLLSIYLLSLFGAMQGVMSEHLAALPLIAGMFYLSKKPNYAGLIGCGFLFGAAIMFRLNLAYALIFIYVYVVLYEGLNKKGISKGFFLTLGSLITFGLCAMPYIITDNLQILKTSVLDASLAYSNVNMGKMLKTLPMVLAFILWAGLGVKFLKSKRSTASFMLMVVMIIGQGVMFFKSGKVNGHYLIQIFPFLAILFVAFISKINLNKGFQKWVPTFLLGLFVLLPIESYLETVNIIKSKKETGTLYNGEGHTIPAYLQSNYDMEKTRHIFFLNEHIGYWVLHTMPPTAIATHPSNIFRDTAYPYVPNAHQNALGELSYILSTQRPNFIVFDQRRIPMLKDGPEYAYLQEELKQNYTIEKVFGEKESVMLYKRKGITGR